MRWSRRTARLTRGGVTLLVVGAASAAVAMPTTSAASGGKAPVKLLAIATSNSPIENYPDIPADATAAAKAINAHGGINGHPIQLTFCNVQADANVANECAREAASGHFTAVVGQLTAFGTGTYPILQAAGIPSIGLSTQGNLPDVQSSVSYPFSAGAFSAYVAMPTALQRLGDKSVLCIVAQVPSAIADCGLLKQGTRGTDVKYDGEVQIPVSGVTDYAPYAEKVKESGAAALSFITTPPQAQGMLDADQSLGLHVQNTGISEAFGESEAQAAGRVSNGLITSGPTPSYHDTSLAGVRDYDAEVKAAGYTNPIDFRTGGMNAWLSVWAVDLVASKISGPITAATLTSALKSTPTVNVKGIVSWDPAATAANDGPKPYTRVTSSKVYFQVIKDGLSVEAGNLPPVNALPLLAK